MPPNRYPALIASVISGFRGTRSASVAERPDTGRVRGDLAGLGWVPCEGDRGRWIRTAALRPLNPSWAAGTRDRCVEASVPLFFEHGGGQVTENTRKLEGSGAGDGNRTRMTSLEGWWRALAGCFGWRL